MVEVFSVNPKGIRGLGNVVSPKSLSDFNEFKANTSSGTDTIDGVSRTVYTSEYKVGSTITLEYTNLIGTTDTSFTVKCTLKNNSNTAINGATVYLDVNDTVLTGTTNSSGIYTFTVNTDGSNKYRFKCYYQGTSSLAGCLANGVVYCQEVTGVELFGTSNVVESSDSVTLLGRVSPGIPGETVSFYEEFTPVPTISASLSTIQSGGTSTLTVKVTDADDGNIVSLNGATVKILEYNPELFKFVGTGGTETDSFVGADSRVTVSSNSNGTSVTGASGNMYVLWANLTGTTNDAFDFFGDVTIDFDVVSITGYGAFLQIYDANEEHTYFHQRLSDLGVTANSHINVSIQDNLATVTVDDEETYSLQMDLTGYYRIGFRGYQDWSFTFKNFVIGGF